MSEDGDEVVDDEDGETSFFNVLGLGLLVLGLEVALFFVLDLEVAIFFVLDLDLDLAGLAPLLDVDDLGAAFLFVADIFLNGTVIKGPEDDEEESVSEDEVKDDEDVAESSFFNVLGLSLLVLGLEVALFLVLDLEAVALFLIGVFDLDLDLVFLLGDFSASGSSLTVTVVIGLDSSSTKTFLGLINGLKVDLIIDSSIAFSVIGGGTASNLRSIFGF